MLNERATEASTAARQAERNIKASSGACARSDDGAVLAVLILRGILAPGNLHSRRIFICTFGAARSGRLPGRGTEPLHQVVPYPQVRAHPPSDNDWRSRKHGASIFH